MTDDVHLDGNALGGLFQELFGREMTDHLSRCGICGATGPLAALLVYRAPGDVVRCPVCLSVLMVIVEAPTGRRVTFEALRSIEFGPADDLPEASPT